ncbi:Panacea domain-containing protein [Fusobacterium necrophorum]|uniref:Panacea domain-containing protein n=1 Tax=Fusobacterium necrophorum TaxID=859 RepID=UPI0007874C09|nr:type II toxin-antitoxin system antitoxin SocA domain-containing protein [Fusobacterium necrophorum]KYM51797.1 hypothetical protein A2U04_10725 [Fusobacterium necrophorum subsp. funduliforme]
MPTNLDMICALILRTNPNISNLVLQKLLYFIQASSLVTTGRPAFEEDIEAWMYGPVVPEVYTNFRANEHFYDNFSTDNLDQNIQNIVVNVTNNLGGINPYSLVNATHGYDTWREAWDRGGRNTIIRQEEIRDYHLRRARDNNGRFF